MGKLYLLLTLLLLTGFSFAQVTVKLQQPPPNQLSINDLWNVTLTNSGMNTIHITLQSILEESTAGIISDEISRLITLLPGTKTITYDDVKSGNVNFIFDRWGILKSGSGDYKVCIRVNNESGVEIGSDSIYQTLNIAPFNILQVEINKATLSDSIFYQVLITNNYTGDLPDNKPKSIRITNIRSNAGGSDSILSISGGVSVGWERTPSKFPPGSNTVAWVNTSGEIPLGTTDLGNIYFGNSTIEPFNLTYEWRNNNDEIIYSKTVIVGQVDACITWDLLSSNSVTTTDGNLTGEPESIGVGPAPAMSVFDYNIGQRLWVGNTGWIAGSLEPTRYVEFNASPVSGNSFLVTNIFFDYGDNQISTDFVILNSEVHYSIDNWNTSTALSQTPLVYLNTAMSNFSASNLNVTVADGQTFSLRIYPYAVQNGSAMTPSLAIHNNVTICGTTAAKNNCTIQVSDIAGKWGKTVLLTARLQEIGVRGNINLPDRELKFYRISQGTSDSDSIGVYINSGMTNANGEVIVMYDIPTRIAGQTEDSDSIAIIRAEFAGDANYYAQSSTGILAIEKHVTGLSVEVISDSILQSIIFKATLTDSDSIASGISNMRLEFFIDNKFVYSDSTNSSGVATFSFTFPDNQDSVTHSIKVSFAGDANYSPQSFTRTFTNTLKNSTLQITDIAGKWGKTVLLTAKLQEIGAGGNINLSDQELKFYRISQGTSDSDSIGVYINSGITNANGEVIVMYDIPTRIAGQTEDSDSIAIIRAEFSGDANYYAQNSTGTLIIEKHVTSLSVLDKSGGLGETITLEAILTDNDENKKGVSNQVLRFSIISISGNGDTTKVFVGSDSTNSSGVASLAYTLPARWDDTDIVHFISVTFEFDQNYYAQSGAGTLTSTLVDVENISMAPTKFDLLQNYPNPFNPTSSIRYDIPETGFVNISIYNILGSKIKVLVNEEKSPGRYEIILNAGELTSGVYLYKLQSGSFSQIRKFILMK